MRILTAFILFLSCFSINICFAQPSNDLCSNATPLPVGAACMNTLGTNANSTDSGELPIPSCALFNGADVWFSVVVPAGGAVSVEVSVAAGVLTDSGMSIYSGMCGALTEIECDDDDGAGLFSMITLTGQTPGDVLFVRVWEFGGNVVGDFNICAFLPPPPPSNDLCTVAISLPVGTVCSNTIGTNAMATDSGEMPLPSCGVFSGGDIWYSVTIPSSGTLTVETSDAGGITDTAIAIYSGTCGALTEIECDDDDGAGLFSMISLAGQTPGDVFFVRVWEFGNNNFGEFNICAFGVERDCDANVGNFGKSAEDRKFMSIRG